VTTLQFAVAAATLQLIVTDGPSLELTAPMPPTLEFCNVGIQGAPGKVSTLQWSPPSALATWLIPHNLGRNPGVTITDQDGEMVSTDFQYLDLNTLSISFGAPQLGSAWLV
jgi:hypothetical protein